MLYAIKFLILTLWTFTTYNVDFLKKSYPTLAEYVFCTAME